MHEGFIFCRSWMRRIIQWRARATDIVLILMDWKEFSTFNYRGKIVIDGRGIVKKEICKEYEGICG